MNLSTISENKYEARKKYAEYMKAVKERHTAEYAALKNAYRELSRGRQIIDLVATIRTGGVDQLHRPKLAVIRADAKLCWFYYDGNMPVFSMDGSRWSARGNEKATKRMRLPTGLFGEPSGVNRNRHSRAVVPSIPPGLMPAGSLERYHILWEAEWESLPVDPVLLRHLGRNLYVVLAQWGLTPLERAVLQPMPSD